MAYRELLVRCLAAGTMLLAGCGGQSAAAREASGPVVTVVGLDSMKFSPDAVRVKPGQSVTIVFKNGGTIAHDLITEGAEQNARLENVRGGNELKGTFRATKPGSYTMVCNQLGHKEGGMVGTIVVGEPG